MSIRLGHPCPAGRPTDAFGWRAAIPGVVAAQKHTGQDWAAPAGTPVLAMHAGRVTRTWWDTMRDGSPAGGNMLELGAAQCVSRYAHLISYAAKPGDEVKAGQVIGYVGRTGAATGDHLHAELLIAGTFVDPVPYINSTPIPLPTRKKPSMATLYCETANDKRPGQGGTAPTWYLAGDSPGTPANWLPVADQIVANDLAAAHGNAVWLTKASLKLFRESYLAPVRTRAA